uniref:SRPBCC family protein n=1 Tax=Pseudonocardia pini TaxID=2758030 RepID=UPI0015F0D6B0
MRLYVETTIAAPVAEVWERSQAPDLHQRWDLRFQRIEYLPREPGEPQHFRYATAGVAGEGVSTGERSRPDGSATSSLGFSSPSPLSPIRRGAGYWRYTPVEHGTRFVTGYDYTARGPFDAVVRPLMGWATAWSFDRLRLWVERGT